MAVGLLNASARQPLSDLERRISLNSGEARITHFDNFVYQRILILVGTWYTLQCCLICALSLLLFFLTPHASEY